MTGEISDEDLRELVTLIKSQHSYDLGNYAAASLKRRVGRYLSQCGISFFELKYRLTNNQDFFPELLEALTVNVTEMFRDPFFYRALKEKVFPILATYPVIKIWHAGCSSGEEAFSMAIMLKEAGLLHRSRIYATDISTEMLDRAGAGIIPLHAMKDNTANYISAGGTEDFSEYYSARYDYAIISQDIRRQIIFSQHNLVTDYVFNEFQLVCCRNVLIYFNRSLQDDVIGLLTQSLAPLGFLAIGLKESLQFTSHYAKYATVDAQNKIFRLRG